ncbi:MAG: TM2 domain-containing protein [Hyphomicrobiaceae bacterium]|nr:TM2 domain-containing protein [Hyphomicrobiaceae bacterium]MCC0024603.1 TM2 domain-containing protein [Hyphomicrobiaceae bacterium]
MITREPLDTETMLLVEQRVANERKSSLLAYLLWFFLGWAGAHRYYLGRFGSGILQLLLFVFGTATFVLGIGVILLGIWGFWALIDLILIPMMVDDHTRTVRRRHERRLGK